MSTTLDALFLTRLMRDGGYTDLKPIEGGRWAGLYRFIFTDAIITGRMGDEATYEDRWCYDSYGKAKDALDAWDGKVGTEPTGWHRHPMTGRRVSDSGEHYVEM